MSEPLRFQCSVEKCLGNAVHLLPEPGDPMKRKLSIFAFCEHHAKMAFASIGLLMALARMASSELDFDWPVPLSKPPKVNLAGWQFSTWQGT